MKGQWRGTYSGTNNGILVADIDDVGAFYDASVYVYDSNPAHPRTFARLRIPKNTPNFKGTVNLAHCERGSGNLIPPHMYGVKYPGLTIPNRADTEWNIAADRIGIKWSTEVGSQGECELPKLTAKEFSDLIPLANVKTWAEFKEHVLQRTPYRHAFRGHTSNKWRLRTAFHRTGRTSLPMFMDVDVQTLHRYLSGLTTQRFDLNNSFDYAAFLNLVQHHGYPTPLLDWTHSPFVAAYFAFSGLTAEAINSKEMVRILVFDSGQWNSGYERAAALMPGFLHVTMLEPITLNNPRAAPQQSISMVTNVSDLEGYIAEHERDANVTYLEAIDLPASERKAAMQDLALMGITAGSLFPGIDGVCRQLKERFFEL